jgi:hypothetical protein
MSKIETKPQGYRVLSLEAETPAQTQETDAEIIERLRERFDILDDMTRAVKKGAVRAMIVSGAPGVGKSFGVEKVLGKHELMATVAGNDKLKKYEIVKGAMSAIGLYSKLYEYSAEKNILVFDDCDSVLLDDLSLNILKAALDTSKRRTIHWNTDSRLLRSEGVPNSFEFKGGAIFITNINFQNIKSKMLRIKQIVADGMLEEYEFTAEQQAELLTFIDDNKRRLRELSLRTVLKCADLMRSFTAPGKWQRVAQISLMR